MTRMWAANGQELTEIRPVSLQSETMIESWIAADPSMIGLDVLIIGRQCQTAHGGRLDLLGIDRDGNLTLIELKRDKTPRDIVAQVLDYGSWIHNLKTPEIHKIANDFLPVPFAQAFKDQFDRSLPENLNASHSLLIVASGFDPASRRIVEYLAEAHDVNINTAFFTCFDDNGKTYVTADFLMDQDDVKERSEAKRKAPWTGKYYVNAGISAHRSWQDMQDHGFIAAGGGRFYSGRLGQLSDGDQIYVYQKGTGYIGMANVTAPAVMAKDFRLPNGAWLKDQSLQAPDLFHDADNPELAEYLVAVSWAKTLPIAEAKWQEGLFANQNIVCKLTHPATLDFLQREFGA